MHVWFRCKFLHYSGADAALTPGLQVECFIYFITAASRKLPAVNIKDFFLGGGGGGAGARRLSLMRFDTCDLGYESQIRQPI